jgi:hypothetical protein
MFLYSIARVRRNNYSNAGNGVRVDAPARIHGAQSTSFANVLL